MVTDLEAADRESTFVAHAFAERTVDLGEIRMNYATAGDEEVPALLLPDRRRRDRAPDRGLVRRPGPLRP